MAEKCAEELSALLLLEEMRCLTKSFREIRERDADYFSCGRVPFERKSIALGAVRTFDIGAGFWVWVQSGGSANVDMTWNGERDAGEARYRFTLTTGALWPFPFTKGQINIPAGESGTMVLVIGRFPVAAPPQHRGQLLDEAGNLIEATNPLDVTLRNGTNSRQDANILAVGGTVQTGRDWSADLDNLQGIAPDQELTAIFARLKASVMVPALLNDTTTTALGASATYTGTVRAVLVDTAGNTVSAAATLGLSNAAAYAASVFSDQAGTLRYQIGVVNVSTFDTLRDVTISASTAARDTQSFLGAVSLRIQYVNGATAQATFRHVTQGYGFPLS